MIVTTRKKIAMLMAEFLGTAFLASVVLAQAHSNTMMVNRSWFIAVTAGITLAVLSLTLGKVSGAHVNPAVTIGLWTMRKIETTTAIVFIAAQMLGGAVALRLFQYFYNDQLQNIAGGFDARIFFAELIGTFVFTFGVAAVVTQKLSGYKAAYTLGASLTLGVIIAATASNGILNPALSLSFNSWSWAYVIAPIAGSVLAMNIYSVLFASEKALMDDTDMQDITSDDPEQSVKEPGERAAKTVVRSSKSSTKKKVVVAKKKGR